MGKRYIGFDKATDQIFLTGHGGLAGLMGISAEVVIGSKKVMEEIMAASSHTCPVVPYEGKVRERIERCIKNDTLRLALIECLDEYQVLMGEGDEYVESVFSQVNSLGYILRCEHYSNCATLIKQEEGKYVEAKVIKESNRYKALRSSLEWAQANPLKEV